MQCPSAPISPRSGAASESMAFGPGWQPLWGEESCNDVEQRAGPVSPSRGPQATRSQAAPSRRFRSRVPAGSSQWRAPAGAAISPERAGLDSLWLRGVEACRQSGGAQSGKAPAARNRALGRLEGRVRPGGVGASGSSGGQLRRPEAGDAAAVATRSSDRHGGVITRVLLAGIRLYQVVVSPRLGNVCRYEPSCSHYAYEAIERHGALRGVGLSLRRLGRCRPFGGRGYDPVPE
jgi:putative membrane protein insertion efficiency factor